jgi:colanic acid biosynthesis glycosyl transferase WcaI
MTERFLLLSPFFHPEPISTGKYNTCLVRALSQKKIAVEVICFHPLYPSWKPKTSHASISGVTIYRGGAWIRFCKNSLIRRTMLEGAFLLNLLRHAGRFKNYSQIVAVLPPMLFLPAVWIAAAHNTKIVAIVHDLQGVMAGASVRKRWGAVRCIVRFLEATALRCCHRVIALSDRMAAYILDSYKIPRSKITVCWPFVTVQPDTDGNRLGHLFADGKKHIVYAGGLGYKQCPDKLASFLYRLTRKRDDVVCHVFSEGPLFDALKKDQKLNSRRLIFHDLVQERDLYELYLRSHIQVIPEMTGLSQGAVPSKLPNLLVTGVPIMYIGEKDSDVWKLIERCRAGICSDSWDFDTLSDLADQLLMEASERTHAVRRMRFINEYAGLFSIDALIKELLE